MLRPLLCSTYAPLIYQTPRNYTHFITLRCDIMHLCLIARAGLPSHPQHELAKAQCTGFGGMVCFKIKGDKNTARKFLMNLKVIFYLMLAREC